mmetsp:Transcript_20496/g.44599  ORF Transcript_20496/g.44599 Transcript_20496/m.44599 type:complete len:84 (-) Transcript_20496:36-287(-)
MMSTFLEKQRGGIYPVGPDIDYVGKIASEAKNPSPNIGDEYLQQEDCRVVPPSCASTRVARDGNHWHMTIITKNEIRQLVEVE